MEKRGKIMNKLLNFFTIWFEFRLIEISLLLKKRDPRVKKNNATEVALFLIVNTIVTRTVVNCIDEVFTSLIDIIISCCQLSRI